MSYKRVATIGDAIRHGLDLEMICRGCARVRRVAPGELLKSGLFTAGARLDDVGAPSLPRRAAPACGLRAPRRDRPSRARAVRSDR